MKDSDSTRGATTSAAFKRPRIETLGAHRSAGRGRIGDPGVVADWPVMGGKTFSWSHQEGMQPTFPIRLYRFLKRSIPVISSCVWTWSRLTAAPCCYEVDEGVEERERQRAQKVLKDMAERLFPFRFRRGAGVAALMPLLFDGLFTDGAFAGFVELSADGARVESFRLLDVSRIRSTVAPGGVATLALETDTGLVSLDRGDFYYFGLNTDQNSGLGRSILSSIPFVSYVERQLVDDMRRASHNTGFHRLHVKIHPPERRAGETDVDYANRANEYFDQTTNMIRQTDVDDNPVTWDDISIEYIGSKRAKGDADSWFINHRAMIEEICSGVNLAPFLLGYSFGSTESWSAFKYDLVMRQALTVQREAAQFMQWLGEIELALAGISVPFRFVFDNATTYQADKMASKRSTEAETLLKLFNSGLIDPEAARRKAGEILQ